jgi:hypothetical protein
MALIVGLVGSSGHAQATSTANTQENSSTLKTESIFGESARLILHALATSGGLTINQGGRKVGLLSETTCLFDKALSHTQDQSLRKWVYVCDGIFQNGMFSASGDAARILYLAFSVIEKPVEAAGISYASAFRLQCEHSNLVAEPQCEVTVRVGNR